MKITFVLPEYPWVPRGGFKVVYEYSNCLVDLGHEVNIIHAKILRNIIILPSGAYKPYHKLLGKCLAKGFRLVRESFFKPVITWHNIDDRVKMSYVQEPIGKYVPDADIVVATSWHTAEYVLKYPERKGSKYYLIQGYENWLGPEERVNKTWLSPLKKIVIARWLYDKGLSLGVSERDMCYIPNAIDSKKYHVTRNIINRQPKILMTYSKYKGKGSYDGIKALELLKKSNNAISAILFGTDARPKKLPSWVEYYRNPSQEFLVDNIYNGSSIFLGTSWFEGWGLPEAEAMACGCAVVSTDNGGINDFAQDGYSALIIPVGDVTGMINALTKLIYHDDYRIYIAENGHNSIQKFKWETSTKSLESYFMSGKRMITE